MAHINLIKKLSLVLLFAGTILSAETVYTLSGVNKVYPVVEISGIKVPKTYKAMIYSALKKTMDDLKIDYQGYDQRALAVIVNEIYVGKTTVVNIKLLIGEQVKRVDIDEKTFATTYQNSEHFLLDSSDDLEDKFEDALNSLLTKFSEQYKEENKLTDKIDIKGDSFASQMRYETNYQEAVKKAKKLHKNIMLVLVANYCPWCRKFEQRVLLKKEVNEIIQKKYIPLILNKEKDKFPKELNRGFTPIVHFINYKTLKSYQTVMGYNNRDEFIYLLETDK